MANSIPKIEYNNGTTDVTIEFDYPPRGLDFEGRTNRFVQKVVESTSGGYQASDNYTEDERNLTFRQVKQSIKEALDTFMLTHAGKRKTFKYFVHKDETDFIEVKLSRRQSTYRPKRTGWNTNNELTYEIKLSFRRAL